MEDAALVFLPYMGHVPEDNNAGCCLAMVLTCSVQIHSALFNLFLHGVLEKGSCSPSARRIEKAVSTV